MKRISVLLIILASFVLLAGCVESKDHLIYEGVKSVGDNNILYFSDSDGNEYRYETNGSYYIENMLVEGESYKVVYATGEGVTKENTINKIILSNN